MGQMNANADRGDSCNTACKVKKAVGKVVDKVVDTVTPDPDRPFPYSGAGDAKRKRDIEEETK